MVQPNVRALTDRHTHRRDRFYTLDAGGNELSRRGVKIVISLGPSVVLLYNT